MACGPIDFRRQQRERWIEQVRQILVSRADASTGVVWVGSNLIWEIVDALQADLRESQAAEAQEIERLRAAVTGSVETWTLEARWCEECGWQDVAIDGPDLEDRTIEVLSAQAVTGPVEITDEMVRRGLAEWLKITSPTNVYRMEAALRAALSGDPE